ncbi:dihydrofolate reductase family protein [Mucilaginibacter sp. P19]|uniref:dihydrofolate reductase family protein n=1 Tax=Mucilaginibacter sp. P19 TaxID=3423947 RepID=UPI003D677B4E
MLPLLLRKEGLYFSPFCAHDILVYGGDSFVSSLIQHDLVDEFYLLVNPAEIGNGQQTFNPLKNDLELKLVNCEPFACGAALLYYTRA